MSGRGRFSRAGGDGLRRAAASARPGGDRRAARGSADLPQVLGVVLDRGAGQALDDVRRRARVPAQEPPSHAHGVGHAHGLGGRHDAGEPLDRVAVVHLPGAQLAEGRDEHLDHALRRRHRHARTLEQPLGLLAHELHLGAQIEDGEHRLEVEAALERGGHLVDAAVAGVRGRDDVEALPCVEHPVLALELGHREHALGEHGQQRVLHLDRAARDLLEPHDLAELHALVDRRRHERARRGPFVHEQGVVPRVLDLVLGGRGATLDGQRRGARHRGRDELAEQRLRGTRLADEHQPARRRERHEATIDQRRGDDQLPFDPLVLVTQEERPCGAQREHPAGRTRAFVAGA